VHDSIAHPFEWNPYRGQVNGGYLTCNAQCVQRFEAAPGAERFVSSADTVYDPVTNLTWQRHVSPTTVTWDEAPTKCPLGFRLPTIQELYTVIDERTPDAGAPTLAPPFAGEPAGSAASYWSSTGAHDSDPSTSKWYLQGDGISGTSNKDGSLYARCVRTGP
jgi:hypothetical protein